MHIVQRGNNRGACFLADHDRLFFIDPLAAAVTIDPAIVTRSLRASLGIGLAPGLTRGMTIIDPSGRLGTPAVSIVEEVRRDRLTALYAASVVYLPQTR